MLDGRIGVLQRRGISPRFCGGEEGLRFYLMFGMVAASPGSIGFDENLGEIVKLFFEIFLRCFRKNDRFLRPMELQ